MTAWITRNGLHTFIHHRRIRSHAAFIGYLAVDGQPSAIGGRGYGTTDFSIAWNSDDAYQTLSRWAKRRQVGDFVQWGRLQLRHTPIFPVGNTNRQLSSEEKFLEHFASTGAYTPVFAKRVPVIPVGPRQGAPLRRCERCEDESPRKLSLNASYSMAGG